MSAGSAAGGWILLKVARVKCAADACLRSYFLPIKSFRLKVMQQLIDTIAVIVQALHLPASIHCNILESNNNSVSFVRI